MTKPGWQKRFIAALNASPNIAAACKAADVSREWAYRTREEDPEFRVQWEEAIEAALDAVEAAGIKRAVETSDTLTQFFLKTRRRAIYGDTGSSEHPGKQVIEFVNDWREVGSE